MDLTFGMINGLCFGIEYFGKDLEEEAGESVVIISFACFQWIIWTGDFEE